MTLTTTSVAISAKPTVFTAHMRQQSREGKLYHNTSVHCENYCMRTDTDPETLLIYWLANEFNLPADLRNHLQYTKLEVLSNAEFWDRAIQGLTDCIELNEKTYMLTFQSQRLILRTAPWIAVSYRQYLGMRYAVAHVWNAKPETV